MPDKDLIRRALMGDQEAQKQCTEAGIVLPCPCCGGEVTFDSIAAHNHLIVELPDYEGGCFVECNDCTYAISGKDKKEALKLHNSRPAPPVGRCKDCLWYLPTSKRCKYSLGGLWGEVNELSFCSCFNPKED